MPLFGFLRSRRRKRIAARPFPVAWRAVVDARFPEVARWPVEEQARFLAHVQVFIVDKEWVGLEGLTVTDEMRVVVAGAAARLARNLSLDVYDDLGSVILHPGPLPDLEGARDDDGITLGRAHRLGAISLSWDSVRHGLACATDGLDVALHELAHVLDFADGAADGTPPLERNADRIAWARACSLAFARVRGDVATGSAKSVLRKYGGTNEAELFAVATEVFFEKPRQLKQKEPALYAELAKFYRCDPAASR